MIMVFDPSMAEKWSRRSRHEGHNIIFDYNHVCGDSNERSQSPDHCYIFIFQFELKMIELWAKTCMPKYGRKPQFILKLCQKNGKNLIFFDATFLYD